VLCLCRQKTLVERLRSYGEKIESETHKGVTIYSRDDQVRKEDKWTTPAVAIQTTGNRSWTGFDAQMWDIRALPKKRKSDRVYGPLGWKKRDWGNRGVFWGDSGSERAKISGAYGLRLHWGRKAARKFFGKREDQSLEEELSTVGDKAAI